jgi:hypothetical protein
MKTHRTRMVLGVVTGWAISSLASGGELIASNYVSVGYGYDAGWKTNETAGANIPTTAPNPGASFTVGDFSFRIALGGALFSSSGPKFDGRIFQNADSGGQNAGSSNVVVVLTAQYTGTNFVYANRFHLDVDQISIYALKHPSVGITNEIGWAETTSGRESVSPSVFLNANANMNVAAHYKQILWNPPDVPAQDAFSMTRTFCLSQDPDSISGVDGFEILCSATLERRETPREMVIPVAESSPFSIGYGWVSGWKTNETASANIPATAPSPAGKFSLGDFEIKVSAASSQYGSAGPAFVSRILAAGSSSAYSKDALFSVAAVYTGTLATAKTAFRLNIDRISIYTGGTNAAIGTTNIVWVESTSGNASTSPPVATLAGKYLFANGLASPFYYTQLSWNPSENKVSFDGGTNVIRTFVLPQAPAPYCAIDGFEIVGSAEVLKEKPPAGSVMTIW